MTTISRLDLGAYEAPRAAALSGVPLSTVYDWARKGVVVPSISPAREKLWSYGDLLTLRLVRWLRLDKPDAARRTAMSEVRQALERFGDDLWRETERGEDRPTIAVAADGTVFHVERRETADGQRAFEGTLDLFAPYGGGVDLRQPAEHLRIAPGRCSGEPHLVGTRLTTRTVASLAGRGYDIDMIARLYPGEDVEGLREALTLEEKLAGAAA
jgi:uncharacterized protein (DUF433 family)/DNA-binding transcriptional MerR regulator